MCHQEFIAYQCGHRSMGVIRPCPLTTAAQNLKPCSSQPTKQYNALTMCVACERTLHFRWVLVREWEHRWMHERGVCECPVEFPGLIHTPRVSGYAEKEKAYHQAPAQSSPVALIASSSRSANIDTDNCPHRNVLESTYTGVASNTFNNKGKAPDTGAMDQLSDHVRTTCSIQGQETAESVPIPQTYTEGTIDGQHRVAIRVPGLYAAEWLEDHRALHKSGECQCPTSFDTLKPDVDESSLEVGERQLLASYRELEKDGNRLSRREVEERVAEITRLFGSFAPIQVDGTKPCQHQLAASVVPEVMPTQTIPKYAYVHVSQLATSPVMNMGPVEFHDAHPHAPSYPVAGQEHQSVAESDDIQSTATITAYYRRGINSAGAIPAIHGISTSSLWGYGSPTPATSSGALATTFWPPHAQPVPGSSPATLVGPGPFTNNGLNFGSVLADNNSPEPGQGQPSPLCGLPVGAGPEGESHMPHWSECRLMRGPVVLKAPPRPQSSCSF